MSLGSEGVPGSASDGTYAGGGGAGGGGLGGGSGGSVPLLEKDTPDTAAPEYCAVSHDVEPPLSSWVN